MTVQLEALAPCGTTASPAVLAIDAKEGVVATRGWTETAGRLAVDVAREVAGTVELKEAIRVAAE